MKKLKTRTTEAWLRKDGILQVKCVEGAEMALEDAKADLKIAEKVASGKKRPFLVDISPLKSMDKDSRDYHAGPEAAKLTSALALIIKSPIGRVIGNFFLGLNRPSFPVKLFTDEGKAIEWLKKQK